MSGLAVADIAAQVLLCWLRLFSALGLATALLWGTAGLPLLALISVPLSASVATFAAPTSMASASWSTWLTVGSSELLLGALLGASLCAPLLAMRVAGALGDALLWPTGAKDGPLARLYTLLAATVVAAIGGLRVAAEVLVDSLIRWPPGSLPPRLTAAPLLACVRLLADAFEWSLLFAGPLVLGTLLALLLLGLLFRLLSPQGAALAELLPLRALLVVALCLLSLSALRPGLQARVADASNRARTLTAP